MLIFVYINMYGLTSDEYYKLYKEYLKPKFYFWYNEEENYEEDIQEENIESVIENFFKILEGKWKSYQELNIL
jgi:hypothetical protein